MTNKRFCPTDWIDAHVDHKWSYIILAIICFIGCVILCIVKSMPWWACILVPAIGSWMIPAGIMYSILLPLMIIERIVWFFMSPKESWKNMKSIVGAILFIVVVCAASVAITRGCAKLFAKPDPYTWEYAYVSENPRATKYHHDADCKYLKQSTYDYEIMDVVDAECEMELEPCKYCLQKNLKHQYDNWIGITSLVFCVLMYLLLNNYSLRSPIVRKSKK